jgi:peptidylprolyl isomerase
MSVSEAKSGDTVKVHYTGRTSPEEVFDSSEGREPIVFTIGSGEIISGFEQAIIGMIPGDNKTVIIKSDEAYGPVMDELITEVDRGKIPPHIQLEEGQMLQLGEEGGPTAIVRVANISDQSVTLDANHPLAGKDLTFDIKLLEIV